MKKVFTLGAVALLAVGLIGCTTVADENISAISDSKRLDTVCQVSPAVHFAFLAIASQTDLNVKIIQKERNAYLILTQVCQDRPANVREALQTALNAYNVILNIQEDTVAAPTQ